MVFVFTGTDVKGINGRRRSSVPFDGPQTQPIVGGRAMRRQAQSYAARNALERLRNGPRRFRAVGRHYSATRYLAGFEAWVNGATAPLYFVSPNQANIQIPYETPLGTTTLMVGNPYINSTSPHYYAGRTREFS